MTKTPLTLSSYPADHARPVIDTTVGNLLRECAAEAGEATALVEVAPAGTESLSGAERTDRTWSYAGLLAEAEQCAGWLLAHFRPGDRITVWAPNIPEWIILEYGAALAGLVLVTANPALAAKELRYVLEQSRSAGLFYTGRFRDTDMAAIAREAASGLASPPRLFCFADWEAQIRGWNGPQRPLPEVGPGDPAQIQYTSGTTGRPKAALLHHRGIVNNARFIAIRGDFPERGAIVSAMPLFHTGGCVILVLGCAHRRAPLVLVQSFDPALMLSALQAHRGKVLTGVPTMLIAMLNHPDFTDFDTRHCEIVVSGGSSVPPELVRRVEKAFGSRFTTVYGQTELSPVVAQTSPDDAVIDKAETVGRPLWQCEVKIADVVDGKPVPVGEQGEICARGYQVMLGYFEMPEATASTIDAEGWLHTGDLGVMDSRGYIRITGRLKDMIIRGGENIYPREIENVLYTHPAILEVAVIGLPDEKWGEQVAAVIRVRDDAALPEASELHAFCRSHLARHKIPRFWYLAEQFPLTGSGKIQKYRLAELINADRYRLLGET